MATTSTGRIVTLDIVRGVAVMGILAMNIVAFAMPMAAYMNPLAYGSEGAIDFAVYAFNFILIDGKMRGLFSFLFGASMLLVIERAEAKGENAAAVHYGRMLVLLLLGAIHFYLIWFGDILFGYATIGMVAFFFRRMQPRTLIIIGIALVLLQFLMMAGMAAQARDLAPQIARPGASPDILRQWNEMTAYMRIPTPAELSEQMALILGPWSGVVQNQLTRHALDPLFFTLMLGPETLAYMLFGMAALKSGYLTGQWTDAEYRRAAIRGYAISLPFYILLIWLIFRSSFSVLSLFTYSMAATVLIRPFMIAAVAALVILVTRKGGWLTQRIAAAGRAAFTNYLGTSILMTGIFYGWGLGFFGELSSRRAMAGGPDDVGGDAGLVQALARAIPIWSAGMVVAEFGARIAATDAAAGDRRLDSAEPLVGGLFAEAAGHGRAALKRVGRLVEQFDRPAPQPAKFDHFRDEFVREAVGLDAEAGGLLDLFGDRRQRLGAELARFAFERVRRDDQRHRVLLVHRLFDRIDALRAVFAKIGEDADEARPKLGPAFFEMHPINDVRAVFHFSYAPWRPWSGRKSHRQCLTPKG